MAEKNQIAIMTWYTYQNYGSVLQASALYHVLENIGYKPDFINYSPKGNVNGSVKNSFSKRLSNKIRKKLNPTYTSGERSRRFEDYLAEKTTCSKKCTSYPELHDLNKEYSAFVCGSDQIWAPICYDSKYFLDFVENPDAMAAYAPSIGLSKIENEIIRERMAQNILRFKHLSVREQQGADLIKKLTGQEAEVVLDPTLLLDSSEWDYYADIEKTEKLKDDHYILCYFLGDSKKYMGYVRGLSHRMQMPFYVIPGTVQEKKSGHAIPFEVGPKEFVSLVKNADYICTDSFHGMAFSINYNIPFSVFKRFPDNDPKNQNSRVLNLLHLLQLENRLTDAQSRYAKKALTDCDFSFANLHLRELRNISMEYLQSALDDALCSKPIRQISTYKLTDYCCGCGACAAVCAKNAITISKDNEGFERCSIDSEKCVKCGRCKTVCPMSNVIAPNLQNAKALYAVKSNSEKVLKESSSGGVGYELALDLLEQGYAICGCAYENETNSAEHIWIDSTNKQDITSLQGSKYIQSVSSEVMPQVLEYAKRGNIAFFGTPCQSAAVDKLLRQKGLRDRAVIVDLICHGVPTIYLWEKYLKAIDRKYHTGTHPVVAFRSKEKEWRRRQMKVTGNRHCYKKGEQQDDFYAFFRRGLCYMESCSDCPYRERSAADIRIGDYWGERFQQDKQGVSMVIANSAQGQRRIDDLHRDGTCQVEQQNLNEYWSVQYPYNLQRPFIRERLITDLKDDQLDLHSLRKKYCGSYDRSEARRRMLNSARKLLQRK